MLFSGICDDILSSTSLMIEWVICVLMIENGFFRGCSSIGRAPALQAGGRRFDSVQLHHFLPHGNSLGECLRWGGAEAPGLRLQPLGFGYGILYQFKMCVSWVKYLNLWWLRILCIRHIYYGDTLCVIVVSICSFTSWRRDLPDPTFSRMILESMRAHCFVRVPHHFLLDLSL